MEVTVDIDAADVVDDLSDQDIIEEIESRGLQDHFHQPADDNAALLENVYYALRDRDIEKVTELLNPLLDEVIGREAF